jgi:hypothetical protein
MEVKMKKTYLVRNSKVNRREFLSLTAGGAAAAVMSLAGCKSAPIGARNVVLHEFAH